MRLWARKITPGTPARPPWKDLVTGNLGVGKAKQQEHLHFFKRAHLSQVSWLDLWPSRRLHLWGFWNSPWRGCNHSKSSVLALVRRSWDLTSFLIHTWLSVAVLKQLTSGGPCSEQMPKETGILGCPHPGLPPQPMPPGHTYCSRKKKGNSNISGLNICPFLRRMCTYIEKL